MSDYGVPSSPSLFTRTLRECRDLYLDAAQQVARNAPGVLARRKTRAEDFNNLMDDLHRGLVLKIYMLVVEADCQWHKEERHYAELLCHHLWGEWLSKEALRETIQSASAKSAGLKWLGLLGPFQEIEILCEHIPELETLINRLANLLARCDGNIHIREQAVLKSIEQEVSNLLHPLTLDEAAGDGDEFLATTSAQQTQQASTEIYENSPHTSQPTANQPSPPTGGRRDSSAKSPSLEDALAELDCLIGLANIKQEVHSLTNFLKLQQRREAAGLPETNISLHMVFTGNPGTGKTTVARIVGKIFSALGVLKKGHLIETDRSGLVAEYAGQTGPKANKKVDEALDGLLFIDEAYSLVARESEDSYGREAVQALLKRAEDDRHRLVVIVAGYPDEMDKLLLSNPGLSSRFSRTLVFEDYRPLELCRIFAAMCEKNHYRLTPAGRLKVMAGMRELFARRDRHFGNGREARNLFEHTVRRMANRLANQVEVSREQLITLEDADIEFQQLAAEDGSLPDLSKQNLQVTCPDCGHSNDVPTEYVTKRLKCPKCQQLFTANWGDLVPQ